LFGPAGGPEEDACHMESGQVDGCGLLVAGGDPTPLFQAVDAPLDGVALLLGLAIVGLRPASPLPRRSRWRRWSFGTGITARMPRLRGRD
jgi:hypothetical protein